MSVTDGVITMLPAPDGYDVDFANPQRQGDVETYWIVAVGNFLGLLFIGQRIYTKLVITRNWGVEDWCLIAAWILNISVQGVTVRMFSSKVLGVHGWEMSIENYDYYEILVLVAPVIYAPATGLSKMTLLLFYHRLSPQKWFQWMVKAMIVIVAGYSIGIFFSLIFACNPIQRSWDVTITTGSCINRPALYLATAGLGIATDVILLAIPIPMVIGLQMPLNHKLGLIVLFAIGSATLVTSIVRLVVLIPVMTAVDQTWDIAWPCMWICVETNMLTICASIPTLRKFFAYFAPKIMGEDYASKEPSAPSKRTGLRTFGSAGTRRNYNKFGESEYDMTTLVEGGEAGLRPDRQTERDVKVGSQIRNWDSQPNGDGESEKAIIQTKTTTVFYNE